MNKWRELFCAEYGWTLEYIDELLIVECWKLRKLMIARKVEAGLDEIKIRSIVRMEKADAKNVISDMISIIKWAKDIRLPTNEELYRNRPDLLKILKENK